MPTPQVIMEGRCVDDAQLRFSPSGTAVASVRMVASDQRKNASGEWEDSDTCWITVVAFKKLAENLAETAMKGKLLTVTGKLRTNEWTTPEGEKRSTLEIVAQSAGLSLKFQPAKQIEVERSGHGAPMQDPWQSSQAAADPWAPAPAGAEPPF